jgi:hypothetical protein
MCGYTLNALPSTFGAWNMYPGRSKGHVGFARVFHWTQNAGSDDIRERG